MPTDFPTPNTKSTTFVVLCFLLSSPIWYLYARLPTGNDPGPYMTGVMGCPAMAAILTRLWYQRNLTGFGLSLGRPRWLILGVLMPAVVGLMMYGAAWLFAIARLDTSKLSMVFAPSFILIFFIGLGFNCVAAFGEELGWRGLLVPELARSMSYTKLSFISGGVWTLWHFPLVVFGPYHGSGPLWLLLLAFVPLVMAASFVYSWMRLISGSVWVPTLLHGSWNYFIQGFFPTLTIQTPEGERMLGEFGWLAPVISVILAIIFWRLRDRLPRIGDSSNHP